MKERILVFVMVLGLLFLMPNNLSAQFSTPQLIAESDLVKPKAIATADVDGDGDKDMIYVSQLRNTIGWYSNDGNGNFDKKNTIDSYPKGFSGLEVADMNEDGRMDIIAFNYNYYGGDLVYYENSGTGSFEERQVVSVIGSIQTISIADFNGDDNKDIIWGSFNQLGIVFGLGKGNFGEIQILVEDNGDIGDFKSIFTQDIDNDADIDIVCTAGSKHSVIKFMNDGTGDFGTFQTVAENLPNPYHINGADFNGDGYVDLILAHYTEHQLIWYENLHEGNFGEGMIIDNDAVKVAMTVCADVDNDGDMDVITSAYIGNDLVWYENLGQRTFSNKKLIDKLGWSSFFTIADDFDGNGQMDIAVANRSKSRITWFQNEGKGVFGKHRYVSKGPVESAHLSLMDSNRDGYMDVLASDVNDNFSYLYVNKKRDGFINKGFPIMEGNNLYLANFNGDNFEDFASYDNDEKTFYWHENIEGNFTEQQYLLKLSDAYNEPTIIDANNDGFSDILTYSHSSDFYSKSKFDVFVNKGDASFDKIEIKDDKVLFIKSAKIDVDNNGYKDIITQKKHTDELFCYFNEGGFFGKSQKISSDLELQTYKLQSVDFNNDGLQDILYQTLGDYRLAWLENKGDNTFGEPNYISIEEISSTEVVLSDLDQDGDMDILAVDLVINNDSKLLWYENMGQGVFKSSQVITSEIPRIGAIATHDFDKDKDIDIVVSSVSHNQIWQLENLTYEPTPINVLVDSPNLSTTQIYSSPNSNTLEIKEQEEITAQKELLSSNMTIRVFPNPFSDYTTIEVSGLSEGNYQFEVMDLLGRKVRELDLKAGKGNLERRDLESGLYFVRILEKEYGRVLGSGKVLVE